MKSTTIRGFDDTLQKARKIYIGSNVDPEKTPGKVTVDGKLNLSAETVIIEPNTEFTSNSDITIQF